MPRPLSATIHTAALANNLAVVRRYAPKSRIWAVVKANAYGHGLARAFPGLRATDGFGLLDLEEAVKLRELGWAGPILLLEERHLPSVRKRDFVLPIEGPTAIIAVQRGARSGHEQLESIDREAVGFLERL